MPTFFSEAQKSLATAMLDRLIPRQGEHPGAGEIGVADYLDGAISASSQLRRHLLRRTHRRPGHSGRSWIRLRGPRRRYTGRSPAQDRGRSLPVLRPPRDAHLQRVLHQPDRARISWTGGQAAAAKGLRRGGRRPQLAGSRRTKGTGVQGRLRYGQSVDILSLISRSRPSRLR